MEMEKYNGKKWKRENTKRNEEVSKALATASHFSTMRQTQSVTVCQFTVTAVLSLSYAN